MPVRTVGSSASLSPVSTGSSTGPLGCKAFVTDATLSKIATGALPPLGKGTKSDAAKTMQVALFSLGFLKTRKGIDGNFGPGTETALKEFQKSAGVKQTGKLDPATLKALDKAAGAQIAKLKAATLPQGSKKGTFRIVADISDPNKTRLYVVGKNGAVQARYLTSPGRAEYPTQGDHFTLQATLPRQPWNPPHSAWAANAKPIPPGIDNPMGILKFPLGAYSQYIHGIPASEEGELGHAASHGCMRMSGSNILELGEKYAEAGTDVTVNRDRATSAKLEAAYQSAHLADRPTDAGREYLFGYVSGELGSVQRLSSPPNS